MSGELKKVEIDVKDEHAFRTGVVQYLQLISDQTSVIPSLKKQVDRHDRIVQVGKYAAVPGVWFLQAAFKGLLAKFNIHF